MTAKKKTHMGEIEKYVLVCIDKDPWIEQSEIAETLDIMQPSVSRALNNLRRKGLLKKEGNSYQLTSKAHEEIDGVYKSILNDIKKATRIIERGSRVLELEDA